MFSMGSVPHTYFQVVYRITHKLLGAEIFIPWRGMKRNVKNLAPIKQKPKSEM